jgi:hypothetical protein
MTIVGPGISLIRIEANRTIHQVDLPVPAQAGKDKKDEN